MDRLHGGIDSVDPGAHDGDMKYISQVTIEQARLISADKRLASYDVEFIDATTWGDGVAPITNLPRSAALPPGAISFNMLSTSDSIYVWHLHVRRSHSTTSSLHERVN